MTLEPIKNITKITEKYELGDLLVPDYGGGGRIEIGVLVNYTKETDNLGKKPARECVIFLPDRHHDYFSGSSIYGGYVKYTNKDGSIKRMFLDSRDNEIKPEELPDPSIVNTKRWNEKIVSLIDKLPDHVRDLFNFS